MKKNIMKKWVKALRSGEYSQGRQVLVTVDEKGNEHFCCLGVLCNIATESGYGEWQGTTFVDEITDSYKVLPTGVVAWAGMADNAGKLGSGKYLTFMNDQGFTFEEIANIIEKNWETL